MVKKDGLVKILDFGLAKLSSTGSGSGEGSQLPTMTGTKPGVVVGTVSYMSPEQASGADARLPVGPVLARRDPVRDGDGEARVPEEDRDRHARGDPERGAGADRGAQSADPGAAALDRRAMSGQGTASSATPRPTTSRAIWRALRDHLSEMLSGAGSPRRRGSGGEDSRSRLWAPSPRRRRCSSPALSSALDGSRAPGTVVPFYRQLTFRRGNVHSARFAPDGRTVVYSAAWDGGPLEPFTARTDSRVSRQVGLSEASVLSVSSKGELAVLLE